MALNNKEAFQLAKKHLLCQKKKCLSAHGSCILRNADGLKCAVGALLPDEADQKFLDLRTLCHVFLPGVDYYLLDQLRVIHDCFDVMDWENRLVALEKRMGYD